MPNSNCISALSTLRSQKSSLSSNSKKSRLGVYRTLSRKSIVDESLFGKKESLEEKCKFEPNKFLDTHTSKDFHVVKNSIQKDLLIGTDMVRELIIPRERLEQVALILKPSEMNDLKIKSYTLSQEKETAFQDELKRIKEAEAEASQNRRNEMKRLDKLRAQNEPLNDLELEAQKTANSLLKKAMDLRQEQEDEIKQLNTWISNAKIQAIRDAQILEKEQIKKEFQEEDRRLDELMEIERKNAIAIQEAIESKKKEAELHGAVEIWRQISKNAEDRLLAQEKVQQEVEAFNRRMNSLMDEELAKREMKRIKQEKLREELDKANQLIIEKRNEAKINEAFLEEKIRLIQEDKAEKEAAFEAEQKRIKAEKEREVARLRSMQERAKDEQSEKDEIRARRAAEANEREWRKKELEAAKKKAENTEKLKKEYACQSEFKRQLMAIQAERGRSEFEKILNLQKELIAKENEEEKKSHATRLKHAKELRRQICEKEQERIGQRNAFFEEGVRLTEEARLRNQRVQEAKERKFKEFIKSGLPPKYLNMVEVRIKANIK